MWNSHNGAPLALPAGYWRGGMSVWNHPNSTTSVEVSRVQIFSMGSIWATEEQVLATPRRDGRRSRPTLKTTDDDAKTAMRIRQPSSMVHGHGNGSADLGWVQSYTAGYTDPNGAWAGGSEVMHIKAHRGSLYAFNGYWCDSHYRPQTPQNSSSAQVLRLDEPNGSWVVDLDTGAAGVCHMKGNIMHAVSFFTDSDGHSIKPVSRLIAASLAGQGQAITPSISVWVRNDDKNASWTLTTLLSGQSGGRKVPRDIEVHRDSQTGVDRIFLLCGDSGVISGAWSSATGSIVWDAAPEFPVGSPAKTFAVRALGMTTANGRLFFSVGGQLYRRHDGVKPSWSLAWQIPGEVNSDVGGIRGLTTIPTPATHVHTKSTGTAHVTDATRDAESLLFVWTPGGHAHGVIYRLDGPNLINHTEVSLQDLYNTYSAKLGSSSGLGRARSSLGGYNKIFPIRDDRSGQLVHLVGFEQSLDGADNTLQFFTYYAGAVAISYLLSC
jgi:hypothetical protein